MIKIYEPYLPKKSIKYAHKALKSSWISNLGEYKDLAKKSLNETLDCSASILTNNGTTSTHLIYKVLKLKKPNIKNLLVPNNVYVAAWNAMLFDGDEINLIPIKTNIDTWNIDLQDLYKEATKRNPDDTAILIVHNLGGIVNTIEIKRQLPYYEIIEDNCEGFMGKYENKYTGTECLASSISFYGNKTITCGEGGAIILKNEEYFDILEKIHSQGQTKIRYVHDILGYNYRMTNIQAAILYGQLSIKEEIIKKKKQIFKRYKKNLENTNQIIFQPQEKNCENAYWMFPIRIVGNTSFKFANEYFLNKGIEIRSMFYPMSYHKHLIEYANIDKEKEAEILLKEIIILPSSPTLKKQEIDYISDEIKKYCKIIGI